MNRFCHQYSFFTPILSPKQSNPQKHVSFSSLWAPLIEWTNFKVYFNRISSSKIDTNFILNKKCYDVILENINLHVFRDIKWRKVAYFVEFLTAMVSDLWSSWICRGTEVVKLQWLPC